ncbi:MAG: alpha/beta hydrolase [Pseudomonadota bacterium]
MTPLSIPYLTSRASHPGADGEVRYTTELDATTAGRCQVAARIGDRTRSRFLEYTPAPVDAVLADFALDTGDELLVYVHGYNVSLERACRQAALLALQTGFRDRVLLFSWPSSQAFVTYSKDARRLYASVPAIYAALHALADRYGAGNVAAHSMGARLAIRSLEDLARPDEVFGELVLIAPDVDRGQFIDRLPQLNEHVGGVTVLASDKDLLLLLSQVVNFAPRLGRSDQLSIDGVDLIDVTRDTGFWAGGHMYHLHDTGIGKMLRAALGAEPVAEPSDGHAPPR